MRTQGLQKSLAVVFICIAIAFSGNIYQANAQKKPGAAAGPTIDKNENYIEVTKITFDLTKKIYSTSLFSPQDNAKLITLKTKLYDLLTENPTEKKLAKTFYDSALIFNAREMPDDAVELLNVVIENFKPGAGGEEGEEPAEGEAPTYQVDYSVKAKKLADQITKEMLKKK